MKKSIIALAISGLMATTVAVPTADAQEVTQIRFPSRNSIGDRIKELNSQKTESPTIENNDNETEGSSPTTTKIKVPTRFAPSRLFWFSSPVDKNTDVSTMTSTSKSSDTQTSLIEPSVSVTTTSGDNPTPVTTKNTDSMVTTTETTVTTTEPTATTTESPTTTQEIPDVEPLDKAVADTRNAFNEAVKNHQNEVRNKENLRSEISSLESQIESLKENITNMKQENTDINSTIQKLNDERRDLIRQRDSLNSTQGYTVVQKQAIVAQAIEEMINDYRVKNGFHKLAVHPDIKDHAQQWSRTMADNSSFGQTEGFTHSPESLELQYSGENIVAFNTDNWKSGQALTEADLKNIAIKAFNSWKDSPGHNDTMLDPTIQIMGVGLVFDKGAVYATTTFNNERFLMDGYQAPRGKGGDSFPQQEATMYKSYLPQGSKELIGLQNWAAPKDYKYRYIYTSDDVLMGGGPENRIDRFANPKVGSDPKINTSNKEKIDDLNRKISERQNEIDSLEDKRKDNTSEISRLESSLNDLDKQLEEKNLEYANADEKIATALDARKESYENYTKAIKERSDFKKQYGI